MRLVSASLCLLAACSSTTTLRPSARRPSRTEAAPPRSAPSPALPPATILWSRRVSSAVAPVVLPDATIYAVGPDGRGLTRLEAETGEARWSIEAAPQHTWMALAEGDGLVAATSGRSGAAREAVLIEVATGTVRWRREIDVRARLTVGVLGAGIAIEHACGIEVLEPSNGRARGARIDGVVVELPSGTEGAATACTSPPRLLNEQGGRIAVLHAPTMEASAVTVFDAAHPFDTPIASLALPRSVRTASVLAGRDAGVLAARATEVEWLVFSVDISAPAIRWSRRVGAERDCAPSALTTPIRFVTLGTHHAVLAQVCASATALAASDGTELFTRVLGPRVAALLGERTAGFWDASSLTSMAGRELVWLDGEGAPRGTSALPADGVAEITNDALLTLTRGTARVVSAEGGARWEASVPDGRIVTTLPARSTRPEVAIVMRSGEDELLAIALAAPTR